MADIVVGLSHRTSPKIDVCLLAGDRSSTDQTSTASTRLLLLLLLIVLDQKFVHAFSRVGATGKDAVVGSEGVRVLVVVVVVLCLLGLQRR